MNQETQKEIVEKIIRDDAVRLNVVKKSHQWFFAIYFGHYIKYPSATFHNELLDLAEGSNPINVVVAFRGSGKSTIMTLSYPLWAILGELQKKNIVIFAQTMQQAKQYLKNIKSELENNDLLRQDLGPFTEEDGEWNSQTLVVKNYDARITVASCDCGIRGIRHNSHRPDLIILDDIEDINSVKTRENRVKTFNWITGDIMPLGDKDTKFIFIGNLLHEDSFLMRLKQKIESKEINGIIKFFPLLDDNNNIAWPGKYPTMQDIEEEKSKTLSDVAWQREYLLKLVSDETCVIQKEWIRYYEDLPNLDYPQNQYYFTSIGVDLAISESAQADYTSIVTAKLYYINGEYKIYILPNPINLRLNYPKQKQAIINCYNSTQEPTYIFVESNGYQLAISQDLQDSQFSKGIVFSQKSSMQKRERLASISNAIFEGKILFPSSGAEQLISQLVNFGNEKHDDLADAFYYAITGIFEKNKHQVKVGTTDIFKLRM